jgi:hypothetical protein
MRRLSSFLLLGFSYYSTSMRVKFYPDPDLDFEQLGPLKMLVVQVEVTEEVVEVLAAHMFQRLVVVA